MGILETYRQVWCGDFEFTAPPGARPMPICYVAIELHTGQTVRLWLADGAPAVPPYGIGPDSLFVAYYASAELGCCLALNWPMPARILDLYAEFRCLTSGLSVPCGYGLLGAMAYFGLDGIAAAEKEDMRLLAMRGGPYTADEQQQLLDYCESDVQALARLLSRMESRIDLARALLRGRFMAAAARIEWTGIPIDTDALDRLRENWHPIKNRLIAEVNGSYSVFVPTGRRAINPTTPFGQAVLTASQENALDPYDLADAAETVWQEERESLAEQREAIEAARRATGLTPLVMAAHERAGGDATTRPGLDVKARQLAGMYPALGIGRGYVGENGYDDTRYEELLWDRLQAGVPSTRPKHDPAIITSAVDLLASYPQGAYVGPMTFSSARFAAYLTGEGIPWPRTETGALALDEDTFKEMARSYPAQIGPLRDVLRIHRGELKRLGLTVGPDGRNRYLLSAFSSKTGRNQPSNAKSIFGPSAWLRCLIKPGPGQAVAYCDWSAQELAIAAALSGDPDMQAAYQSGDPYLWLASKAGAVPSDATKRTHPTEREQFKIVSLGVLYGLSGDGIARRLNVQPCKGRELLQTHQETFRTFWRWSGRVEMQAMLVGRLQTVFGWLVHVGPNANPRSLRNFPMQGNGAEMMRIACCLATEQGIRVCAPIHDALLVEGPADEIDAIVARTTAMMREASRIVLNGFEIRVDAKVVRHPDRYIDGRGQEVWDTVMRLLEELGAAESLSPNAA